MSSQLKQQQNWVVTASLSVVALVAIAFVLHYTRDVLVPFVIAIFVGALVAPLMDIMELKWKWRHSASVGVALVVVMLATVLFGAILMASIHTIATNTDKYKYQFQKLTETIDGRIQKLVGVKEDETVNGISLPDEAETRLEKSAPNGLPTPGDTSTSSAGTEPPLPTNTEASTAGTDGAVDDGPDTRATDKGQSEQGKTSKSPIRQYMLAQIPELADWLLGQTATLFSGATLTIIFVMFVLAGRDPKVVRQGIYQDIDTKVRSYISAKIALSLATGILVWISLSLLKMEMAAVFGVLAFLLNFIPSIGSIISTLVPIPFALAMQSELFEPGGITSGAVIFLLGVILLPGAVQMIIGNVIEPKLMGDDLQLHPIAILLALAIWGLLWGPVGMLLAVPMTAIIRIVLMKFEITRIAGNALAGKLPDLDEAERKASGTATTSTADA